MIKIVFYGVILDILILWTKIQIKKINREIACNLNYDGIEFPVKEMDFKKIEVQNKICINVFS